MRIFFLIALLASPLLAQEMPWETCVQQALTGNADVLAAKLSVSQAEFDVASSYATYLPNISAGAGYGQSLKSPGSSGTYSVDLSISQRLFPGILNKPEVARAVARLESAKVSFTETMAAVRFDLKSAYVDLRAAQEKVDLTEKISRRRKQNLDLVNARFNGGRENKGALLRSQAQYEQAQFEFKQAGRALEIAQYKLAYVMGIEFAPIQVPDSDEDSVPASINIVVENTPAVTKAKFAYDIAAIGVTTTEQSYSPVLSASLSGDKSGTTTSGFNSDGVNGRVSLSIPLYSGGRSSYDILSAKSDRDRFWQTYLGTLAQTKVDIKSLQAAAIDAIDSVAVQKSFAQSAVTRAEIAKASYTTGLLSFENWDIIENDLIAQEQATLSKSRDAVLAVARLEKLLGKGF